VDVCELSIGNWCTPPLNGENIRYVLLALVLSRRYGYVVPSVIVYVLGNKMRVQLSTFSVLSVPYKQVR